MHEIFLSLWGNLSKEHPEVFWKQTHFPVNFKPLSKPMLQYAFNHLVLLKGNSVLQTLSLTSLRRSKCRAKASSLFLWQGHLVQAVYYQRASSCWNGKEKTEELETSFQNQFSQFDLVILKAMQHLNSQIFICLKGASFKTFYFTTFLPVLSNNDDDYCCKNNLRQGQFSFRFCVIYSVLCFHLKSLLDAWDDSHAGYHCLSICHLMLQEWQVLSHE